MQHIRITVGILAGSGVLAVLQAVAAHAGNSL